MQLSMWNCFISLIFFYLWSFSENSFVDCWFLFSQTILSVAIFLCRRKKPENSKSNGKVEHWMVCFFGREKIRWMVEKGVENVVDGHFSASRQLIHFLTPFRGQKSVSSVCKVHSLDNWLQITLMALRWKTPPRKNTFRFFHFNISVIC